VFAICLAVGGCTGSHTPVGGLVGSSTSVSSVSSGAPASTSTGPGSALAWANELIDVIEAHAYYAGRIDLAKWRRDASIQAEGAHSPAGLYPFAGFLIGALGDAHSSLIANYTTTSSQQAHTPAERRPCRANRPCSCRELEASDAGKPEP
jgi:hypothetical protein